MGVDGVSGNNPLADLIDHSRIKPQSPLLQAVRMIIIWLVVSTPLKNISQLMSAGITIPNICKIRYVPNHQPVIILIYYHYRHSYRYYTVRRVLPRHEH